MIEFFVKRPVTTWMFILTFVVIGIVSFFNLKLEKQPKVDFPIITVFLPYPGATSYEIEKEVIDKVEESLSELSAIKRMNSIIMDNTGYVFIEFNLSSNIDTKYMEVKSKIESLNNKFPTNMKKVTVKKFNPFVTPVIDMVLSDPSLDEKELFSFADDFKKNFLKIPGVANVEIFGGKKRQINISLNPLLMKKHYISIEDVISSIHANNQTFPGGVLDNNKNKFTIRYSSEINAIKDFSNIVLVTRDLETITLGDIAKIEDGYEKVEKEARFNGNPIVIFSIIKNSDANAKDVSKKINNKLPSFHSMLKKEMSLKIANDSSSFITYENHQAFLNILIGILLTIILVYLFTGNIKLLFIASITIPISIISSFFLMDISGFSINFMTLLAVASSLGTLIANTIVIIENFWNHLDKGKNSFAAAIDGTKEMTTALLASCGTNLVVFTPIAFMNGIIGQFMKSFGLTVIYLTIFSLLVSFTLTPMLLAQFLKHRKKKSSTIFITLLSFLREKYTKIFNVIFKYRKTTLFLIILFFFSIKFISPYIGNDFFPKVDQSKIFISIKMPDGTSFIRTKKAVLKIEEKIKNTKEIISCISKIGTNGNEEAEIILHLLPISKRKKTDQQILENLVVRLSDIIDADITLKTQRNKGFDEGDISINIYGLDDEKMIAASKKFKKEMIKSGYFRSINSSYNIAKKEIVFIPNQQALLNNDISSFRLGNFLRSSIYGNDSFVFKENEKEYPIHIFLEKKYLLNIASLTQLGIIAKKGWIPIEELGKFEKKEASSLIYHRDRKKTIKLNGFLAKSDPGHVSNFLKQKFEKISKENKVSYSFVGDKEHADESTKELIKAFILAVLLTYMLLCAILNSFLYPIAIVCSIVTSFIGVFYSLFFLEESINVASMLGMVMLVGLVINNSILLLDSAIKKMKKNMEIKQALLSASYDRFVLIMITSLSIILGVVPQLFSVMSVKSSMGAVMIGGMIASLIFTFILTPILFYYLEKMKMFFKKK